MSARFFDGIRMLHARGVRGQGEVVGHLDTGVDAGHPALRGKVRLFQSFSPDGYTGALGEPTDRDGHGTHMAGLLVGEDGVGMAPEASLLAGAVIEEGNIVARLLLGLDWLASQRVGVIVITAGLYPPTPALRSAIRYLRQRDVLIVAPIGNLGAGRAHAPGCYADVLAVGAMGAGGRVAPFSGSVNTAWSKACLKPEVVAPGVNVRSTVRGGGFTRLMGTSAAAACVGGVAVLLRQAFPDASAETIRRALIDSSQPPAADQRHRVRYGMVRPMEAFNSLMEAVTPAMPVFNDSGPATQDGPPLIEERLRQQMAYGGDEMQLDAVLEFKGSAEAAAFERSHVSGAGAGGVAVGPASRLEQIPLCLVRCTLAQLRVYLSHPALTMAAAADVDRSPHFRSLT